MTDSSSDPVVSITEADASGDVAVLYADIRASLGVPVVNLIWRHLATITGALPWAWESVRPLYANGVIAAEAAALRAALQLPVRVGLSAPALAAAGLSARDLRSINTVLLSYERSNAMNVIALGALLARLDDVPPGAVQNALAQRSQPQANVDGDMPSLLSLAEMTPTVRTLVEDLNRLGGRDAILPSMYRHLAHWPAYLALIHGLLAPLASENRLEPVINAAMTDGRLRGARISGGLARPAMTLDAKAQAQMRAVLLQFMHGPLAKMTAIVRLIGQSMPS